MKKWILSLSLAVLVSACAPTHGKLKPGEVMGTDIGNIVSSEIGLDLSAANLDKMNSEIDKALYFSDDGLTTRWYAGYNVRLRPIANQRDRRDRDCRRFRHGHMIDGQWMNATAIACRERNIAWYLISNHWDHETRKNRRDYFKDLDDGVQGDNWNTESGGGWQNLSGELSGNIPERSNDDFSSQRW